MQQITVITLLLFFFVPLISTLKLSPRAFFKSNHAVRSQLFTTSALIMLLPLASPVLADDVGGASSMANAKITTGGASTLQSGRTIAITRGVNLDRQDFR